MLRLAKIILVGAVALWGLLGALFNLTDWSGTIGAVSAATSMSTVENSPDLWKATSHPAVIWLGALFIMLSKLTSGVVCAVGAQRMWLARGSDAASFRAAKEFALLGCAIAVIMLFGGFIVIAEIWYELWRSNTLRDLVLESTFRYAGLILLIALFVGANDD